MNHTDRLPVPIADQRLCRQAELGVRPQISALHPWREAGVHCHRPSDIRVGGRWYRSISMLLAMIDGDRPVAVDSSSAAGVAAAQTLMAVLHRLPMPLS